MSDKKIKKVLVVQPFGIGDSLFVTPVIRALKELAKVERLDMMLGSRTKEVFERDPWVDRVFVIDRDRLRKQFFLKTFWEMACLLVSLRKTKYDLLVDCSLSREYGFYAKYFARIPERIGFNYKNRGIFLTRTISLPGGFEGRAAGECYAELLALIGITVRNMHAHFFLKEEDKERAKALLGEAGVGERQAYAAVVPGGGDSWGRDAHFKQWSPFCFAQVLNAVSRRLPVDCIVVLGTEKEYAIGQKVVASREGRTVNLCGKLSLVESAAVLKNAVYLLANDSGLVHAARALNVPCIAVYGPVDEKVYGAYPPGPEYLSIARNDLACRPCYRRFRYDSSCRHRACLTELSPVKVIDEIVRTGFFEQAEKRLPPSYL